MGRPFPILRNPTSKPSHGLLQLAPSFPPLHTSRSVTPTVAHRHTATRLSTHPKSANQHTKAPQIMICRPRKT